MNLPVAGHPLHTRSLSAVFSQLEGGKLRARGNVIDLRKCSFTPMMGDLQTAGIIHDMRLGATIDIGTRVLESLETEQAAIAVEPSRQSRGESCRDPASRLQALVGRPLDSSFGKALGEVYGGPRGCTHLLTLFQLIASAVPRALDLERAQLDELGIERRAGETIYRRSVLVDGYESVQGDLQLAIQHHDVLQTPRKALREPIEALAAHWELRALATLNMQTLRFSDLMAEERHRSHATLAREIAGEPVMPGLGRKILERLGTEPELELLKLSLLQLTPAFVQCTVGFADRFYAGGHKPGGGGSPSVMEMGGTADSCYMWRSDGPLLQVRTRSRSS